MIPYEESQNSMNSLREMNFEDALFKLINFDNKLQVYNQVAEVAPHLVY